MLLKVENHKESGKRVASKNVLKETEAPKKQTEEEKGDAARWIQRIIGRRESKVMPLLLLSITLALFVVQAAVAAFAELLLRPQRQPHRTITLVIEGATCLWKRFCPCMKKVMYKFTCFRNRQHVPVCGCVAL